MGFFKQFVFFILSFNLAYSNINPSININEINDFKYHIDIEKNILNLNQNLNFNPNQNQVETDDGLKNNQIILLIKSVQGQSYQCELPDVVNDEYNEDITGNLNPKSSKKFNHNFTLIGEQVTKYLGRLREQNICIFRNTGWWTYEFCFGSHINQFHRLRKYSNIPMIITIII